MIQKTVKYVDKSGGGGGAVWFFGFVGALFYFIPKSYDIGTFILAVLKSIVWPAYFVFHIFSSLNIT